MQENWLYERAILGPTNEEVDKLNHQILLKVSGNIIEYM